MKKTTITALIAISSLAINAQSIHNFSLKNLNNEEVSYDELKGSSLTILDFWATWCKPCVNSIPKLVELSEKYNKSEVAFIGINIDSPRNLSKVKPFAESKGISYPILLDTDQEIMAELNVASIPTLIIVKPDGSILSYHEGFAPGDETVIEEEINNYLNHEK